MTNKAALKKGLHYFLAAAVTPPAPLGCDVVTPFQPAVSTHIEFQRLTLLGLQQLFLVHKTRNVFDASEASFLLLYYSLRLK